MTSLNDIYLYCMSNGSEKFFPQNTLTKFKCKLPFKIEYSKNDLFRWYFAIECVGFDPKFTTSFLPKQQILPSLILVNEKTGKQDSVCAANEKLPEYCSTITLDEYFQKGTFDEYNNTSVTYYYQEESTYNSRRFFQYFKNLENLIPVKVIYNVDRKVLQIQTKQRDGKLLIFTHTCLHQLMPIRSKSLTSKPSKTSKPSVIKGETYLTFFVNEDQCLEVYINDIKDIKIPNIVKLQGDFVRDQIFNDSHTKDLVCFSPPQEITNFCFYEVVSKNFLQLENTVIDTLEFELVDGKNQRLSLHIGTPSIVKVHFKKMLSTRRSFHVRLSQNIERSIDKNNSLSKFKIRLPRTLEFDRDWTVALSSILIPGRFCTFPSESEIVFSYKENGLIVTHRDQLPLRSLTRDDLIEAINTFFASHPVRTGKMFYKTGENDYEPTVEFTFSRNGLFILPEHVCRVLGYGAEDFTNGKKIFKITLNEEGKAKLKMSYAINLDYYQPNYIMVYSNIVEPSPVNAELTNILKVFHVSSQPSHNLYEFKHLEHHRLLNNEISEIEIEMRNHAGDLITFEKTSTTGIIVNLLFSNY